MSIMFIELEMNLYSSDILVSYAVGGFWFLI